MRLFSGMGELSEIYDIAIFFCYVITKLFFMYTNGIDVLFRVVDSMEMGTHVSIS